MKSMVVEFDGTFSCRVLSAVTLVTWLELEFFSKMDGTSFILFWNNKRHDY